MEAGTIPYFMAAFAWAAICVNVVVVPFYSRPDNLFKELVDGGALGRALASIDSKKLIPALAKFVEEAVAVKERHLSIGDSAGYEELLQEVDFLPQLERAQAAIREKQAIEQRFEYLRSKASSLWKAGLIHSIAVVGLPVSMYIDTELVRVAYVTMLAALALLTFFVAAAEMVKYDAIRRELHTFLEQNRG